MNTVEKMSSRGEDSGRDPEQQKLAKHQKKLVGYYLSSGDFDYIFDPESTRGEIDGESENNRATVFRMIQNDAERCQKLERRLLLSIARSNKEIGPDGIFKKMQDDKHQKRILASMTGLEWDEYGMTDGEDVRIFMRKYPTPMDFERDEQFFLGSIGKHNSAKKLKEYKEAMDDFCHNIYGKKYEYYKAIKGLHEEAEEWGNRYEQSGEAESRKRRFGNKILNMIPELGRNKERLIQDSGVAMLNKGALIDDWARKNEDASYFEPSVAAFGVFDGAGGVKGAARASGMVENIVRHEMTKKQPPDTAEGLARILMDASRAVLDDKDAGITTAVLGRIVEDNGRKKLIYAAAGDSRIYVIRDGRAHQITVDEGYENVIYNCLGSRDSKIKQKGEVLLRKGDKLVFCSDGITGDVEKDFIPEDEFVQIVSKAGSADEAATGLVHRATKRDDRTAIVVEV